MKFIKSTLQNNYLYLVNLVAIIGMLASLYYSEVEKLNPCNLCWYQRIFFYPVVIVSSMALAYKDLKAYRYLLALSLPGMFIALYHYLLQKVDVVEGLGVGCNIANPCTNIDVEYFGFITIPLLSFLGFAAINIICIGYLWARKEK